MWGISAPYPPAATFRFLKLSAVPRFGPLANRPGPGETTKIEPGNGRWGSWWEQQISSQFWNTALRETPRWLGRDGKHSTIVVNIGRVSSQHMTDRKVEFPDVATGTYLDLVSESQCSAASFEAFMVSWHIHCGCNGCSYYIKRISDDQYRDDQRIQVTSHQWTRRPSSSFWWHPFIRYWFIDHAQGKKEYSSGVHHEIALMTVFAVGWKGCCAIDIRSEFHSKEERGISQLIDSTRWV
jgi:hypothetical protein